MIKTEPEYQECLKRLKQDQAFIAKQRADLKKMGLSSAQIEKALEPLHSFHDQLQEEAEWYERVQRRDFQPIRNLNGLGQLLIAVRIATGLSQKELAVKLGVDDSQVSRDERNEYHGISIERAEKVLLALGVELVSNVELKPVREDELAAV
jgi:ribosome-binding protein aMBF1 (putative translation factor)